MNLIYELELHEPNNDWFKAVPERGQHINCVFKTTNVFLSLIKLLNNNRDKKIKLSRFWSSLVLPILNLVIFLVH